MPERPDPLTTPSHDPAPVRSAGGDRSEREAASDDLANFEAFFHGHYGALCEYIRHIVHLPHLAEELAQDAFVSLQERHTRAPVQMAISYLYTMARNRAHGYLRHRHVVRNAAREMAMKAAELRRAGTRGRWGSHRSTARRGVGRSGPRDPTSIESYAPAGPCGGPGLLRGLLHDREVPQGLPKPDPGMEGNPVVRVCCDRPDAFTAALGIAWRSSCGDRTSSSCC